MNIFLPLLVIVLATVGIFQLRVLTAKLKFTLNPDALIDQTIKFQGAQLILAALVLAIAYFFNPENFLLFFRTGDVDAHISPIAWLGIAGTETWLGIASTLGLWITLGTGIFMFFQLKKANVDFHFFLFSLLWSIPFSMANAFSEEAIFRIGIVSPLYGLLSVPIILIISGALFGLPHYFGTPSGIIGVIMAGFLGWLLAMSLVETHGLFLAWAIHFVQDVVIITSIILMSKKETIK
ncbi:MAG: CPBP family intramembrane metalloprotease [Chloroflexi bacterium]|nr:CPBP family intramembrane metalloprotease [Chloroflexota bacterium]